MTMSIAANLALALDPVLLAVLAGFTLDQWQLDLLRLYSRLTILNCSRQVGKSTITAFIALHQALFHPGSLILLTSPSQRQSLELFRRIKVLYNLLPDICPVIEESALRMELENGSRIVCLPGREETLRGFSSVSLLILDEAARISDDLWIGVRPMVAVSNGRVVLLSSPFGRRGFFYDVWANGGDDWRRVQITAAQCQRIAPKFLEAERRSMPDFAFRSEYLCQFTDTVDSVFASEDIARSLDATLTPLFGG